MSDVYADQEQFHGFGIEHRHIGSQIWHLHHSAMEAVKVGNTTGVKHVNRK